MYRQNHKIINKKIKMKMLLCNAWLLGVCIRRIFPPKVEGTSCLVPWRRRPPGRWESPSRARAWTWSMWLRKRRTKLWRRVQWRGGPQRGADTPKGLRAKHSAASRRNPTFLVPGNLKRSKKCLVKILCFRFRASTRGHRTLRPTFLLMSSR